MTIVLKTLGAILLLVVILVALAITIVPRFLDRIYYRGVPFRRAALLQPRW